MPFFQKLGKPFTTGTGPPPTDDLTVPTRDELFEYQMMQKNPLFLKAESLYIARICETHQYANSVFHACQRAHVITAEGLPDTTRIDSSLVSKVAIISVPKMRELTNMLFFWEEEVMRLRLLDDDIREIQGLIKKHGGDQGEGTEELQVALKVAKDKREVVPSKRARDGTVGSWAENQLPAYE